jgi:hypothetical protein
MVYGILRKLITMGFALVFWNAMYPPIRGDVTMTTFDTY